MLIVAVVDFGGRKLQFPISVDESSVAVAFCARLKQKLQIAEDSTTIKMDLRNNQGMPISRIQPLSQCLSPNSNTRAAGEIHVLLDGNSSEILDLYQRLRAMSPEKLHESSVERYDIATNKVKSAASEVDDASDEEEPLLANDFVGLHQIKVDGFFAKSYIRGSCAAGSIVFRELPDLCVAYPTPLSQYVRTSEWLKGKSFDPNFRVGGDDDKDISKFVSIARTHGTVVATKDAYGAQIAFYGQLSSIRHSCHPTCYSRRFSKKAPYAGVLWVVKDLEAGDETTMVYDKVESVQFLLLPKDRRQRLLQHLYHFTCDCPRCWKDQPTLTGAFFHGDVESCSTSQKKLSASLRSDFDALDLGEVVSDTVIVPKTTRPRDFMGPRLLQFILKYSASQGPLKLHVNHWRLSLARIAYMILVSSGKCKIEKATIEICLTQLATEGVFLPPHYPSRLSSYTRFQRIVAKLPDSLAASVQRMARQSSSIDFGSLAECDRIWGKNMGGVKI